MIGRIDESLDDFEQVAPHLDEMELSGKEKRFMRLGYQSACCTLTAFLLHAHRHHKSKEHDQRLARAPIASSSLFGQTAMQSGYCC